MARLCLSVQCIHHGHSIAHCADVCFITQVCAVPGWELAGMKTEEIVWSVWVVKPWTESICWWFLSHIPVPTPVWSVWVVKPWTESICWWFLSHILVPTPMWSVWVVKPWTETSGHIPFSTSICIIPPKMWENYIQACSIKAFMIAFSLDSRRIRSTDGWLFWRWSVEVSIIFFGATPAVTFFMRSIVMITVLQEHEISHLLNSANLETTPTPEN